MKKLLLISTLLFSSPSYAEWTKVSKSVNGNTYYVDVEKIEKVDGYVYFWRLRDYPKPDEDGDLSSKIYHQGDCIKFQYKYLSGSFHKRPMGGGTGHTPPVPEKHKDWKQPSPNSLMEEILKLICEYAYTK